jgi:hypothetical protein
MTETPTERMIRRRKEIERKIYKHLESGGYAKGPSYYFDCRPEGTLRVIYIAGNGWSSEWIAIRRAPFPIT